MTATVAPVLPSVTLSEHEGVRYLHLGTPWVQGAMRLGAPQRIELEYVQRMLAALLWLPGDWLDDPARRAVQLGLGAATLTRFAYKALRWDTTAVEVNAEVVAACRAWFRLGADTLGLRTVLADAGVWIAREAAPSSVHLLHVDLYDAEAAAPAIDDEGFYRACRAALAPQGVMAVNLFGRSASFDRSLKRIAAAFDPDPVWRLRATREGNTIVIAARAPITPSRETLRQRAEEIERRFAPLGLPARKWLRMVSPFHG